MTIPASAPAKPDLSELLDIIEHSRHVFRKRLEVLAQGTGMTREIYIRYLSFQHHQTKGVQRHFVTVAGHPDLADKPELRNFLFQFALEEEPHYKVAEVDLKRMGEKPLPCPLDVSLWLAYFDQVVQKRPFVRLGATCILENLGAGAGALGRELLDADFLSPECTRFLDIHFHEELPHGDQIIEALESGPLSDRNLLDLKEGAHVGSIMYLRFVDWATKSSELTVKEFDGNSSVDRPAEAPTYLDLEELTTPS